MICRSSYSPRALLLHSIFDILLVIREGFTPTEHPSNSLLRKEVKAMAEPDKQYTGDGNDNYADAARKSAEAVKQVSSAAAEKAAAGAEATSAAAASTVKAGIEGGKAVSEIAAGTAAGGPWGAVVAAAWSLRHTLYKILVTSCLCLLFIIILIVSLPSILFDNMANPNPDPSVPTELFAIYADLSATVSACVTAGHEDAKSRIESIIANGGYDRELSLEATVDNGIKSTDYDVCYILAAYSASMEQRGTTKADMEAKLNAVVSLMFPVTYEVKETTVEVPPENEDEEPTERTVEYVACTIHSFDTSVIITAFEIDINAPYGEFQINTGVAINNMAMALKQTLYDLSYGGVNGTHTQIVTMTAGDDTPFVGENFASPIAGDWRPYVSCEINGYVGHTGMDLGIATGTELRAMVSGRVLYTKMGSTGYGYYVVLYHGGGIATLYAHCSQILVSIGQEVSQGDMIALSGDTGRSTGPHVHLEVIVDGVPVNPRLYLS